MTKRKLCPIVAGPIGEYGEHFDELLETLAQRSGFRKYLQGLLLPRERNKTLTGIVGSEPIVGAQDADVQQMQYFLTESKWDAAAINQQRLNIHQQISGMNSHDAGVLVIDDTGDRKSGRETAHVGRQYLGSVGKIDQGIVAVSSLWADEYIYYPLHVKAYTPAEQLPLGKQDADFHKKAEIALALIDAALDAGIEFRAIVADAFYGEDRGLQKSLLASMLPYVLAIKPSRAIRAPEEENHTPSEFALDLHWAGPAQPGDWQLVIRQFRDGHEEYWWATEFDFGSLGPNKERRMIVATTDPATLPELTTWYLETNIPRPSSPVESLLAPADLAEIVRLYGLRTWIEQSYKQVKQQLGWADFMVRSDVAIERHWYLIFCAFSFCWWVWLNQSQEDAIAIADNANQDSSNGDGEKNYSSINTNNKRASKALLASSIAPSAQLANALDFSFSLVESLLSAASSSSITTANGQPL
jgi:hypothetical protein